MEQASTEIQITTENLGKLSPIAIFKKGGISPIIDAIISEVTNVVPDTTTAKGRNEIASLAHKIAKSKTLLDKMGKALADDLNSKLKPINAERKLAREELDTLKEAIRHPLTEWEAEQKRIAEAAAARVEAEELAVKVENDHELGILLHDKFIQEQAAKLAEAAAARVEAERKIAEDARIEAEQKAKAEIERVEREKQEAIEREEQAKRNQIAAEERAKVQAEHAEIARLEAVKQAHLNAEFVANQAREYEIERQKEIHAKKAKDEADRLANRTHVSNFRGEAKLALVGLGLDDEQAKKVVMAIHGGVVPHIKITY